MIERQTKSAGAATRFDGATWEPRLNVHAARLILASFGPTVQVRVVALRKYNCQFAAKIRPRVCSIGRHDSRAL
ncbi:hypothetical protein CHELA41_51310 [Hyphomicrobiales bacterium]|nr:hypothetical protein CHELA41_51310 [Hyphomicrobiales bacterium]